MLSSARRFAVTTVWEGLADEMRRAALNIDAKKAKATAQVALLTARETQILNGIVGGRSAKEMAVEHRVSLADFGIIKDAIHSKLGAFTTADIVRIALYAGLEGE